MAAPRPNPDTPSSDPTYPNPNSNPQHSGFRPSVPGAAQLVAFHQQNRRCPPETPSRRCDAVSDDTKPSMGFGGRWGNHTVSQETPSMDSEMGPGLDHHQPSSGSQHPSTKANPQHANRFSSGESGNSSTNDQKMGDSSHKSGHSGQTRRSTAEDWFNSFNADVRGHQSYPNYESVFVPG